MKIQRVESVVYGVNDVDNGIRFFEDWGLRKTAAGPAGATFTLASGQTVVVKPASDASLPSSPETGPTAREVIWGVDSAQGLEELRKDLARDREVKADPDGTLHSCDDVGFGIGLRIAAAGASIAREAGERMNRPYQAPDRATPTRIGHVVYSIARKDQKKAADFYTGRLQFRVTDHTQDMGDFMRCSGSTDHHNLFMITLPDRPGFHHVAFEVRDFDEIIIGGKFMKNKGWPSHTPPGRHILGSNLFWYFQNPNGGNVEYFADMDLMDDSFQTRNWEKSPGYAMWMLEKSDAPEVARPGP